MKSQEDWENTAIAASNLSDLELTLGEVGLAVGDAEQSVTYADLSGDAFQRLTKRVRLADALHQNGRREVAETRFCEAEQMQVETDSDYPRLYSLQGFQYCDLLLAAPERAAWREVSKQMAEGTKQKAEKRFSIFHLTFLICHRRSKARRVVNHGGINKTRFPPPMKNEK